MVATAIKHATKSIIWTTEVLQGFEQLKAMVNTCPKLYFINNAYKVVLYTDASDYAQLDHTCVGSLQRAMGRKRERNQKDSSVARLAELKCDGQQSKRKRMPFIGRWVSWMTY